MSEAPDRKGMGAPLIFVIMTIKIAKNCVIVLLFCKRCYIIKTNIDTSEVFIYE